MIVKRLAPSLFCIVLFSMFSRADTVTVLGTRVPLFNMPDRNSPGNVSCTLRLADQFSPDSRHAVIVSFFAEWCAPCRQELPFLQKCADSLADQGLRLVVVCLDRLYIKKQREAVREMKLTCPVVHDRFGTLAQRLGFKKALPYTVFVNRKGMITGVSTGYEPSMNAGILEKIQAALQQQEKDINSSPIAQDPNHE
jgi:thiol-disulfide isomerase/thioredoxin